MKTCFNCAHAVRNLALWNRTLSSGWPPGPLCAGHPASPGDLRPVPSPRACRNFRPRRTPPLRITPPEPADPSVRHIALTKGKFAILDASDYDRLAPFRWFAKETRGRFYAATTRSGRIVTMHRMIMRPPKAMLVDHIDGNSLNNRRSNLRICTPAQNRQNTRPRRKTSRFIGVSRRGKEFIARIKHKNKSIYLGTFSREEDAAHARDKKAEQLHPQFAYLNFPPSP